MISIFTPTYNRAYILNRCYASLLKQSSQDFVWLIIDDGSKDNTSTIVEQWQQEGKIKIRYIKQENGGKHAAHNTAVRNCETRYILIFDSDDVLDEDCVQSLNSNIHRINRQDNICGIIGNKFNLADKSVIGSVIPKSLVYASGSELYQKYNFTGDTLRLYKTSVLKEFPFPIIPNEKFIYENVVFDQIDAKYKMLVIHDRLYYCDYLEDGYTANANKIKVENPIGYSLSLNSSVKYSAKISKRLNWTILYIMWSRKLKIRNGFNNFSFKPLYLLLYPFAMAFYILRLPRFFFNIFDNTIQQNGKIK